MNKILIVIAALLSSCNDKDETSTYYSDESQILNLALDNVIGSDTQWRHKFQHPPIPVIAFTDKFDSIEYLKIVRWQDSVKRVLETATLFVEVFKDIIYLDESNISYILHRNHQDKSDTSFDTIIKNLCDQKITNETINIGTLKPRYNYKILQSSEAPKDRLRKIGSIRYSKISFNTTKDKACIYSSFLCGELCGNGYVHFFQKKDGKWVNVRQWEIWVS